MTFAVCYLGLKAIVGVSAHVAMRGTRTKRFEAAASAFNAHPQAAFKTRGKTLRDHFNLLRKQFSAADKKRASQSGKGEELSERDKILADMLEAVDEIERQQKADKSQETRKHQKLAADGLSVRKMAIVRRANRPVIVGEDGGGGAVNGPDATADTANTAGSSRGKRLRRDVMDLDQDVFLDVLERSELRRQQWEKEQLECVERRFERLERAHREERAAHLRVLEEMARRLRHT